MLIVSRKMHYKFLTSRPRLYLRPERRSFTLVMVKMLPEFLPLRYFIIYLTGLIEIALGFGLLPEKSSRLTGILAIAFLIAVFPANVYAAINSVKFSGNIHGSGGDMNILVQNGWSNQQIIDTYNHLG